MSGLIDELALSQLPYAVLLINKEKHIIDCNPFAEQLTEYSRNELVGKNVDILFPNELLASYLTHKKDSPNNRVALSLGGYICLIKKSKQQIKCLVKACQQDQGYALYFDQYHEDLPASEHFSSIEVQRVLDELDEAFWEWNIEQDLIAFSAKAMFILGYETAPFIAPITFLEKHLSTDAIKNLYRQFHQHSIGNRENINITTAVTTTLGDKKWINVVGKVFEFQDEQPYKMFGSIKDVTESQQLITELKKQNGYLHLAEQFSNSGHWRIDIVTNQLYWSRGIYGIHGVSPSRYQPSVESALAFYIEGERDKVKACIDKAIEEKKGFHLKSTIINAAKSKVKIEIICDVELDHNGDVVGIFGVSRDITKAEDLFEKLKLLAMVNYTIKVPIFFINDQDHVVYQDLSPQQGNENSVLFNYINFSIKDYLGFKAIAKEKGQLKRTNISFDKYITVFDLSVTYEPDEGIYIWIVENVTEKFRVEQQQIITNRLALLGNTFGNVSHDINNVLGVALGATEMLELKFAQGEKDISGYIERVKNAIDKGKSVTERLLAFTRKPTVKVIEFDPIQEIKENHYLFKQLLLSTIDFTTKFDDVACLIKFPQGEFINILLNLVLNAQDAIQEQGLIGKIEIGAHLNEQGYLEIYVKDSGIGIKQENLTKIFDPFYSSKSVNKGNGIGLANVYSTIYKYNGQIQVAGESDLGGAEFTLVFQCRLLNKPNKVVQQEKSDIGIAGKSILILDDELSIAEFVSLFLESEGAKTEYITSKPALTDMLSTDKTFDIFITDMILPDISGRDAVGLVKAKFPEIKVYSISGYIAEENNNWHYPVLRKPFNSKELGEFLLSN